jgi:hypothetical protein
MSQPLLSSNPPPISAEQAIAMLPDGDTIHTMCAARGIALGADWTRKAVIDALHAARKIHRATGYAREIGHGIVIVHNGTPMAIQTRPDINLTKEPE